MESRKKHEILWCKINEKKEKKNTERKTENNSESKLY